jgi:hypothetical protein
MDIFPIRHVTKNMPWAMQIQLPVSALLLSGVSFEKIFV